MTEQDLNRLSPDKKLDNKSNSPFILRLIEKKPEWSTNVKTCLIVFLFKWLKIIPVEKRICIENCSHEN